AARPRACRPRSPAHARGIGCTTRGHSRPFAPGCSGSAILASPWNRPPEVRVAERRLRGAAHSVPGVEGLSNMARAFAPALRLRWAGERELGSLRDGDRSQAWFQVPDKNTGGHPLTPVTHNGGMSLLMCVYDIHWNHWNQA